MKKIVRMIFTGVLSGALCLNAAALSYPIDVEYPTVSGGPVQKTYVVESESDIAALPRDAFVLGGTAYEYTDTICKPIVSVSLKPFSQTEISQADTNDASKLAAQMKPTIQVTTQDGYSGVLILNEDSITAKAASYGYGSSTKTLERIYPNLSDADANYVPKTVEANGRTYTLADVSWTENVPYNVYDEESGSRYTATVTYSSTNKTSWVKEYEVSAEYSGSLSKATDDGYQCTLLFYPSGSAKAAKVSVSNGQVVTTRMPVWAYVVGAVLLAAAIGGCTYTVIDWRKKHSVE